MNAAAAEEIQTMEMNTEKYPSVTEIISNFLDTSFFTAESANRGTAVHEMCSDKLTGVEDPKVGEGISGFDGYKKSFLKWMLVMRPPGFSLPVPIVEKRIVDDNLKLTGKPDFIGTTYLNEGVTLIDFKTSHATYPWWVKQLAAYKYLIETSLKIKVETVYSLRLRKDGGNPIGDLYSEASLSTGLKDFMSNYKEFNEGKKKVLETISRPGRTLNHAFGDYNRDHLKNTNVVNNG